MGPGPGITFNLVFPPLYVVTSAIEGDATTPVVGDAGAEGGASVPQAATTLMTANVAAARSTDTRQDVPFKASPS